ncbi:hypothetical protein EP7_000603 [Isosphaeraceae bacterium EP7]
MNRPPAPISRREAVRWLGLMVVSAEVASPARALAAARRPEPAQVVPLEQLAPNLRDSVAETIRESTLHRKAPADSFPCNPRVYMTLLNEPLLTLALWQDLSASPVKLRKVALGRYEGEDGAGTTGVWEYAYRSPKLNVMHCSLNNAGPRGNTRLEGRVVLIVRSGYYKEVNGEPWVQHDLEAFVKVDSKGWKAAARTARPVIEKLLEDQIREAGWFVSLMGRLVETHPDWAIGVANRQPQLSADFRGHFVSLVQEVRKPDANPGRPVMAANATGSTSTARR